MNKTELIAAAAESAGLTKKDTERVINAAIDAITAALVQGDKVQISGFGAFGAFGTFTFSSFSFFIKPILSPPYIF